MSDVLVLNADGLPVSVLPLSVMSWQDAVKAIWLEAATVVDNYTNWQVHSPSVTMTVPSVIMTTRYVRFGRSARFTADNIKLRDRYRCAYCGEYFPENKLTLDHVHPRSFGGRSTWDNLTSACSPCNGRRGTDVRIQPKIKPYKPSYYELADKRREFPLVVPHHTWVQYVDWPEDLITVCPPKKERVSGEQITLKELVDA